MIREKINTERLLQGFSVRKLAIASGMQVYQLGQYLKGNKTINSNNIESILKVLNVDFDIEYVMFKRYFTLENKYLRTDCPCCGGTVIYEEGCENCKSCFAFIAS